MLTVPVLEIFDDPHNTQHKLHIDARTKALGAVLLQKCATEASFYPIVYFTGKLNPIQYNYFATDQEMLAIIETLKHFHPYLHGTKFIIYTDHRPLMDFFSQPNLSPKQL